MEKLAGILPRHEVIELRDEQPDYHWRLLTGEIDYASQDGLPQPGHYSLDQYRELGMTGYDYCTETWNRHGTPRPKGYPEQELCHCTFAVAGHVSREYLESRHVIETAKRHGAVRLEIRRLPGSKTIIKVYRREGKRGSLVWGQEPT